VEALSALVEEVAASAQSMDQMAKELQQSMQAFKLDDAHAAAEEAEEEETPPEMPHRLPKLTVKPSHKGNGVAAMAGSTNGHGLDLN